MRRFGAAFAVLLTAAGCRSAASTDVTRSAFEGLPPQAALRAFVYHDRLLLAFRENSRDVLFKAKWKGQILEKEGDYRFRMTRLELIEKLPPGVEKSRPSVREAQVVPLDRVPDIVARLADRLAPADPGQATFLALGAEELFVRRDTVGRAFVEARAEAPPNLRIARRLNPTQFAREIFAFIAEQRSGDAGSGLYLIEGVREGRLSIFWVFDLDQRVLAVILPPGPADVAADKDAAHGGLRKLEAALVEGQLVSALKNPVSFLGRAANFAYQTLKVVFRSRRWPSESAPPPVAESGAGMDLAAFEARLDSMMGTRRYRGAIHLFIDGSQFFPLLEKRVDEARESLHFQVCIWDNDDVGVGLADRVRRRASEIPDVRVVVDRITTLDASLTRPASPMPEGFTPVRAIQPYLRAGSTVRVRNFLNGMTMGDHSKVYIVDRRYAYLGGMNVGREYRFEWHDAMVELEGPVVGWFERDFQLSWAHAGILGDLAYGAAYLTEGKSFEGPTERRDYVDIRPVYTKTGNPAVLRSLIEALRRARRYAWIENPYIYDDAVIRALVAARARGVDVRVVMPTEADMNSADSNNKVKANLLLARGVRVYAYPGMTHAKAALVDGWALLGSCNFNKLSLRTNDEADIATSDPGFAARFKKELFEADFDRSRELTEPLPVTGSDRFAEWLAHQT